MADDIFTPDRPDPAADTAGITARLVLLRQWLGLSQREMAARLGMTVRAYHEWERPGIRRWERADFALKVADATGVSIDWLILGAPFGRGGRLLPKGLRLAECEA